MELIEVILSKENLNRAYKKVVANKGASGVDGVTVEELGDYIRENKETIIKSLRNRTYMPKPVRRVYIPKENGKKRPLGIPTALDRTIQQAIAQPISDIGCATACCMVLSSAVGIPNGRCFPLSFGMYTLRTGFGI